jgi:hypothetical protein
MSTKVYQYKCTTCHKDQTVDERPALLVCIDVQCNGYCKRVVKRPAGPLHDPANTPTTHDTMTCNDPKCKGVCHE